METTNHHHHVVLQKSTTIGLGFALTSSPNNSRPWINRFVDIETGGPGNAESQNLVQLFDVIVAVNDVPCMSLVECLDLIRQSGPTLKLETMRTACSNEAQRKVTLSYEITITLRIIFNFMMELEEENKEEEQKEKEEEEEEDSVLLDTVYSCGTTVYLRAGIILPDTPLSMLPCFANFVREKKNKKNKKNIRMTWKEFFLMFTQGVASIAKVTRKKHYKDIFQELLQVREEEKQEEEEKEGEERETAVPLEKLVENFVSCGLLFCFFFPPLSSPFRTFPPPPSPPSPPSPSISTTVKRHVTCACTFSHACIIHTKSLDRTSSRNGCQSRR